MNAPEIRFDADRLIMGIVYHLCDSRYCEYLDADAFTKQLKRLRRQKIERTIQRSLWRQLSNFSRLVWLVKQTDCELMITPEGMAQITAKTKTKEKQCQ